MDPHGSINLTYYKKKMDDYEMVFDAVINNLNDEMFGIYSNSVERDRFQSNLMSDGWKFFDFHNLNEFFSIKYKEMVDKNLMDEQQIMETLSMMDVQNMSMNLAVAPQ